jgi:hypothetical protein
MLQPKYRSGVRMLLYLIIQSNADNPKVMKDLSNCRCSTSMVIYKMMLRDCKFVKMDAE